MTMRVCIAYLLPPEPLNKIQSNYVFLTREMDTKHTDLLDRSLNDGVLNLEEKQEIESLSSPSEQCARLLSILRRKTQKQYEIFVEALIASNQSHVASVLKLGSFSIFCDENSSHISRIDRHYSKVRGRHVSDGGKDMQIDEEQLLSRLYETERSNFFIMVL